MSVVSEKIAPKAGWILFAVSILGIMIQVDYTAVNVALVDIAHSVHSNLDTIQWVLSAYVLAWGALVLAAGRCADLYGKRRTFLIGTVLFMLGSGMTGAATSSWFLILGRVVQGIGGALFLPGLYTLVFTNFPEHKRGFAMGVLSAAIALGMAIGPTFGGLIVKVLSWRWIFFLNIPLGIPVIAIILWAVEKEPWRLSQESMDFIGAFLIALLLFIFMFALDRVSQWSILSFPFISCLAVTLILLIMFVLYERKQKHPLVQLAMFANRTYLGCILIYIFVGMNFASILIMGGLYLQNALAYSSFKTGFVFLVMTASFALLSVFSGKLTDKIGPKTPVLLGQIFIIASFITFIYANEHSSIWVPIIALILAGNGFGLVFPALNNTMLKSVPQNLLSTASSAFAMFGCIGNTIGLIVSSVFIVTIGQRHLFHHLAQKLVLTTNQASLLRSVISSTHYQASQLNGFSADQTDFLMQQLRQAFVHAMHFSVWMLSILTLISIIFVFAFIHIKPKKNFETSQIHII